jgi:tetratricopeptide (TPR) repeat protein
MRRSNILGVVLVVWSVALAARADELFDRTEAAARAAPTDVEAQIAYVEALVRAARYDDAAKTAKQALRSAPRSLELLLAQARVVFARHDFKNAKLACRPLERLDPRAIQTRICLAEGFVALQRSARAFEEIEKIIDEDPDSFEGHLAKADALRLRMIESDAEAEYRTAARLRPKDPRPHIGLGLLAEAAGKPVDALTSFRRARTLGADWPEVRFAFGRLTQGEVARSHLRAATEMRRNWVEALEALAWAELDAGEIEEAKKLFTRAIEIDRLTAGAHLGLGLALVILGRDAEARPSLTRSLELVPTSARAALALARLEARAGEIEVALEHYRRAADQDRADFTPLLEAAELCVKHERAVVAMAYLDRVLEVDGSHSAALMRYGDAKRIQRKPDEARRYYERALRGSGTVDKKALEERIASLR